MRGSAAGHGRGTVAGSSRARLGGRGRTEAMPAGSQAVSRLPQQVRAEYAGPEGSARPVFAVGVQHSGADTVLRGFEEEPSVEVHDESDQSVFDRCQIRDVERLRSAVHDSRRALVMFKPLCDSHRTADLLDAMDAPGPAVGTPAQAVWIYRGVDGLDRQGLRTFGDANRQVLAEIAHGTAWDRWQAQRLSEASLELIRTVDPSRLSPESAAALIWLVRNRLYFEQDLDERDDVHLVSYDRFVGEPDAEAPILACVLGLVPYPVLWSHLGRRHPRPAALRLDPRIRNACDELESQLAVAAERCCRRAVRDGDF